MNSQGPNPANGSPSLATSLQIVNGLQRLADFVTGSCAGVCPVLAGIHCGGVAVAQRVGLFLDARSFLYEAGSVNITFYRDDLSTNPIPVSKGPTRLPKSVDGRTVVLVDDVFCTGRTARAALEEVFSHGRPERVLLATLVCMDGRKLPLVPDSVGLALEGFDGEKVRVCLSPVGESESDSILPC